MKPNHRPVIRAFCLLVASLCISHAQPATNLQLRLEPRTNSLDLVVDGAAATGAFFIYQAHDLQSLLTNPSVAVQTNTPLTNGLRFALPAPGASPSQAFFTAAHWPGRTVEEFGEPENYPDLPPPAMVLFTSGAPAPLASGQTFTVDFFVTDPAGQLLDVSGPVAVLVFRESDGALHPDATVSPPTGQLTNGHLRLAVTVQSITSLDGYVLGIGPSTGRLTEFLEEPLFHAAAGLNQFLKPAFNLGPAPLPAPTAQALLQTLEQRRTDSADAGPSWSYPLAGSGHPVSGTFGEWRGKDNNNYHRGVDLAAVAASTVVASRGGVVSHRGTIPGMGDYVVVDHGGGWFSRYLHLDSAYISVNVGQAVARGATLATRLYAVGTWPQHLHFEIQRGANQSQWNVGVPGIAQDPLQTPSVFTVPPGGTLPQLREFGLTRQHLGQNAFVKGPPTADAPGPVYLFAKFLDPEPKPDGKERKLALRAMRFQPEGLVEPVEIRPTNATAITAFLPPGANDAVKGFARYDGTHAANPDPANWFRYWWRWDTSSYANDRRGPRAFVLTGEDHAPSTAEFRFTFGPQVKGGTVTPLSANQYQFTNVAYLGTNTPLALGNAALFVQPDQYKLEIIQANGQPLGGVVWAGPMAGGYTRLFTVHTNEEVYTFTLPGATSPDGLKLRVSSRLVPDIAHEICLCGGPDMAFIPAGSFTMGSPPSEPARVSDEGPQTRVTISQGFYMGKYEVTQAEYLAVMGSSPSYFVGDLDRPVERVSWNDCVAYCAALTTRERNAGRLPAGYAYRLPTEAEWEYACRAGTTTAFHYGPALRSGMANFYGYYEYLVGDPYHYNPSGAYLGRTTTVGSYAPNAWGLYDMHGNVWEWCSDWWSSSLPGGSVTDPQGAATGSYRVIRGGGSDHAFYCRSAGRGGYIPGGRDPDDRNSNIGFRVVLAPDQP